MPADIWIVNLVILAAVLQADLGTRKVTWLRVLRPFAVALLIIPFFVKSPQWSGNALLLELALLAGGVVLGVAGAIGLMRVGKNADSEVFSNAGIGYAIFWIAAIGARLVFSYGAYHWYTTSLGHWMATNRITTDGLTDGLIFLAIAMAISRTVRIARPLITRDRSGRTLELSAVPSGGQAVEDRPADRRHRRMAS
jgi:hypothetical protein